MESRALTQMQFHLNEAISCPISDTLIWTNRYPGGNFDTFVIKKKCICLIIFIERRINHGACSIQQIFVAVVSRDKSIERSALGTSGGNEIWIRVELKTCENTCYLCTGIVLHWGESHTLSIILID